MTMIKQSSLPEMVAQSRDVLANPSVTTFERYEQRGSMSNAAIYVGIAIVVAAFVTLMASLLPGPPGPSIGIFIGSLLSGLTQFFVFTGMVYLIGKNLYRGSGTWNEVAYTFALFTAPLIIIGAVLAFIFSLFAWIPLVNIIVGLATLLIGLLLMLVQIYYGYLAIQSSMNLRDQSQALITLILSFATSAVVMGMIGMVFR